MVGYSFTKGGRRIGAAFPQYCRPNPPPAILTLCPVATSDAARRNPIPSTTPQYALGWLGRKNVPSPAVSPPRPIAGRKARLARPSDNSKTTHAVRDLQITNLLETATRRRRGLVSAHIRALPRTVLAPSSRRSMRTPIDMQAPLPSFEASWPPFDPSGLTV
jgi:hypothetical protein